MSSKSRNSLSQANKASKPRKSSTATSFQNEKQRSVPNLADVEDIKISDILKAYTDSFNNDFSLKIIIQNDPLSNSAFKFKDHVVQMDKSIEAKYNTEEYNRPIVHGCGRSESEGPLTLMFKNGVGKHVTPLLNLVTPYFKHLSILQITYCELHDTQCYTLITTLRNNTNIKSLSLDGNSLLAQSYSDLGQIQLSHLSLRSCQISLLGIKNIVRWLQDSSLTSLNLSSNYLDDDCLQCLSYPLRLNRKLSTLNLADNWFTDVGLMCFVKVFTKFNLEHNEIVMRRRANIEYLREHQGMVKDALSSELQLKQSIVPVKSLKHPIKNNSLYISSRASSPFESQNNASAKARAIILTKDKINAKIKNDNNPLIIECYSEDKSIYCRGNFTLTCLNISYNNISSLSLIKCTELLNYQFEFCKDNKCLLKLVCDDYVTNKYPLEWLEITELLKLNSKVHK